MALLRRHPLFAFFALACGLSWFLWAPIWLPTIGVEGLPVLPFHQALGALGPLAAAFVVCGVESGRRGTSDLLRRMVLWRGRWPWLLVSLLGPFLMFGLALLLARGLGGAWPSSRDDGIARELPWLSMPGAFLFNLISYGLGEETGWRGFALPRLQRRHSALVATLLLTLGWALWHWPLLLPRPGRPGIDALSGLGWFSSLLVGALLLTWLTNEAGGSILVVALFHAGINVAFQADVSSRIVLGAAVALLGLGSAAILYRLGPRHLARHGKVVSEGATVIVRKAATGPIAPARARTP